MKDKFHELYEITKLDRKKSPWSKKLSFERRLEELKGEINEAIEAYESRDMEHFKDELGDIYWDLTFLITMAEEKGLFNGEEVFDNALEKFKRRKPWIFQNVDITEEEEVERWNIAKKKEKEK
ncbi:MazG nucleotide pyrophosphohydrolase domain-containing protein [Bacteroidota bacterium]